MKRREFLKSGLAGSAAATIAAPAVAQSAPEVKWRLTSSFPRSLDTLYGASELLSRIVAEATDGKFQIQVFSPGEIVPGLQALDAVGNATVEMAHSSSFYYIGKDTAFAFATAMPFGLNARQQNAWIHHGGGQELMDRLYAKFNLCALPGGNTNCQMGGWFRKEIRTVEDLDGLKMRIGGLAGQVMQKLGAVPQQIAGGDIYPALEKGSIDAVEWGGPYDDEKLGFARVAPYYYYPGWWEGGAMLHFFFNLEKLAALPPAYRAVIRNAAAYVNVDVQAKYDAFNPGAIKRLVQNGALLRPFSTEIMEASWNAAKELYAELNAKNPEFKTIYDSYMPFRSDQYLWQQIAELSYDAYMIRQRTRG